VNRATVAPSLMNYLAATASVAAQNDSLQSCNQALE
jgi:hypothetical protein